MTFLLVALVAIGVTLLMSWDLEGGAAAVNQAGSERMRAYRIAMLLSQAALPNAERGAMLKAVEVETEEFERVLAELKAGDPSRPLFLPREPDIQNQFTELEETWLEKMRPAIEAMTAQLRAGTVPEAVVAYGAATERFVDQIDRLVFSIERDISQKTTLLRSVQMGLIVLSVAGTVTLIYLMFLLVVRPVSTLDEGMRRMEQGDFDIRLPVESRDEFGSLASGFNRMASRLSDLYRNLEAKVAEKTRSLEQKNRELYTLYEIAALLNRPGTLEEMCREFLGRLINTLGSKGGAVRLVEQETGKIHLYVQQGLSVQLVKDEACIDRGECLCGEAARDGASTIRMFTGPDIKDLNYPCRREGFRTVTVFPIRFKDQILGVFNLYFETARELSEREKHMLESLGQHLGVAIENQRLIAREKEMAVSEERNLLAQELHDSIAQSLAFLNLQAQMLGQALEKNNLAEAAGGLKQIREGIQESYDDVRELLVHFRTRFGESDIETVVRALLSRFEADTGVKTRFVLTGTGVPLSPEKQIQVLHIVQECLSNVRKHADAGSVTVTLEKGPAYVLRVADDGHGFDASAPGVEDGHVGLAIMRERAQRIGGSVNIESSPTIGTAVTLTLPIVQQAAA
ncbi:MAG: type IV pili methyl-accepting chemotaxis transducer N-terminal domain-containing protein [Betaproteobacteria bacterium]|nr:MAG: type IV pili methyl-accepting chemotaxis transducer N-terminal domain-containing protein [Betaproteobacteria bacterium]